MKTIYDLELHESLDMDDEGLVILRVASGWLYKYYKEMFNSDIGVDVTVCDQVVFVPYDNTFKQY